MSEKKYYVVGVTTPEVWDRVHTALTQDGTLDDNIPSRSVECTDLKEHSPTRAVYLMTDEEVALLTNDSDIQFIQIDASKYLDLYPPNPDKLHCERTRYSSPVINYRVPYRTTSTPIIPDPATPDQLNRAGYQLLRSSKYINPWLGINPQLTINSEVPNSYTGKDVDVIVGDDGCWFGHIEFINNTGNGPSNYVGGNKLPGNGICDLLDLVLDSPYYLDPAWFNASPSTRLTTRWDGTVVPVESVAREWWGNSAARSSSFRTVGTVNVGAYYTRAFNNGSNTARSAVGDHGTACAAQAYGRTFGWAYNANKWFINAYGYNSVYPLDNYFDIMKIFHLNKPINPARGTRDPTISSNSYGFRDTTPNTGYYYFRQGTTGAGGVAYNVKPKFMYYLGGSGDSERVKGEMVVGNLTTSGDELIASGVIFVVAAGNSNQKQVNSSSPDYNNYWSVAPAQSLSQATNGGPDALFYNTTSRRGFPQQLGKYTDNAGSVIYPAINIGALDDAYHDYGIDYFKEQKVGYSDMGNEIDCYAPGNNTLSACRDPSQVAIKFPRWDSTYNGATIQSFDRAFNGTSSACPTACGLIATLLEVNRSWGWADVRNWISNLNEQPIENFLQGPDPSTANSADWAALNSLMGGKRKVIYSSTTEPAILTVSGGLRMSGSGLTISFN